MFSYSNTAVYIIKIRLKETNKKPMNFFLPMRKTKCNTNINVNKMWMIIEHMNKLRG